MAILNETQIKERMNNSKYGEKLLITPLLSEKQIGPASVDIRLGSSIIIPKKTYVEKQDVTDVKNIKAVEHRLYEKNYLRYNSKFILHPNHLILGVTFEYISLPSNIFAVIVSRSSWGRLGLIVATASAIQPGFKGSLTLELVNCSESPIALYPGLPIGQLIFHEVNAAGGYVAYDGRYNCPTEAELPKFFSQKADRELGFWGSQSTEDSQ
jgi:dCTP deaminase